MSIGFLARLNVSTRLLVGFCVVVGLGLAVAMVGIAGLAQLSRTSDALYRNELLGISYIKEANINLVYASRARANFASASSEQERQQHVQAFRKYAGELNGWIAKARPAIYTDEAKAQLARIETAIADWLPTYEAYFAAAATRALAARDEELARLDETARQRNQLLDQALTELTRLKEASGERAAVSGAALYERLRTLMIALTVASTLLGVLFGIVISRSLTRQLGGEPGEVASIANAIAAGDLSTRIDAAAAHEGSVMLAMQRMQRALATLVGDVRRGVDQVTTASAQIAAGNQDLSSRTEEQASSLQQAAASMEQLTGTVRQSTENARQASMLASSASTAAEKGGSVVSQVVATMDEISSASKKIADIIGVIDGIAFQTNILALNAAVEAARAGEQGRGFAVVAGEVRTLAQRSAQAAKEIRGLISDSVLRVDEGSRQVADAGQAMQEIVTQVKRVTDLIQEISSAALEQSSGITQINEAVTQMDRVTQQNVALVEESAAAASSLREQAERLAQAVEVFKLSHAEAQQAIEHAQAASRVAPAKAGAAGRERAPMPTASAARKSSGAAVGRGEEWTEF